MAAADPESPTFFLPGGFAGTVWRAVFAGQDPCLPVPSAEGRFHHSGQSALYTSLTPEGCVIAIRRYLRPSDPRRILVPLTVKIARVADLRGRSDASVVWQDDRAAGQIAPTWRFSDAARAMGAEAMLYSSRSRPDLSHLVLFTAPGTLIQSTGPARDWPADQPTGS